MIVKKQKTKRHGRAFAVSVVAIAVLAFVLVLVFSEKWKAVERNGSVASHGNKNGELSPGEVAARMDSLEKLDQTVSSDQSSDDGDVAGRLDRLSGEMAETDDGDAAGRLDALSGVMDERMKEVGGR